MRRSFCGGLVAVVLALAASPATAVPPTVHRGGHLDGISPADGHPDSLLACRCGDPPGSLHSLARQHASVETTARGVLIVRGPGSRHLGS